MCSNRALSLPFACFIVGVRVEAVRRLLRGLAARCLPMLLLVTRPVPGRGGGSAKASAKFSTEQPGVSEDTVEVEGVVEVPHFQERLSFFSENWVWKRGR